MKERFNLLAGLIAVGTLAAILLEGLAGTASFGADAPPRPDEPKARVVVCPTALFATQEPVVAAREGARPPIQERGEVDVETPLGQVRAVLRILEELKEGRRADAERFAALLAELEARDARAQERFDALADRLDEGDASPASALPTSGEAAVPSSKTLAEAARWERRWATRALVGFAVFILARNCVETFRRRREGDAQAG